MYFKYIYQHLSRVRFLVKKRSKTDQRVYYLKLTKKGFEALKIHDQFHKELADLYQSAIPEEHVEWLLQTLGQIKINLDNYRQELEDK